MNCEKMRYLLEIEKYHSITKAAKSLYIAQPNLSKIVKEIEEEYGIKIFKRTSAGIEKTPEGFLFLSRVRNILEKVDQLDADYTGSRVSRLDFSITIPRASYIAFALGEYLSGRLPYDKIGIRLLESNSMTAINNILEQDYHMGIIRYNRRYASYYRSLLKLKGLSHRLLLNFHNLLLISEHNPLAKKDRITEKDLESQIEIRHGDTVLPNGDYEGADEEEREREKYINVYERGCQFEILMRRTDAYMWVSPLMPDTLKRYGLVQKKCDFENQEMTDLVIWSENYKLTEFEIEFLSKLDQVVDELEKTI